MFLPVRKNSGRSFPCHLLPFLKLVRMRVILLTPLILHEPRVIFLKKFCEHSWEVSRRPFQRRTHPYPAIESAGRCLVCQSR
jgi:hypothetical protein